MSRDQAEIIVATLERVRQRPGMYVAAELPAVVNFLAGFYVGCSVAGVSAPTDGLDDTVVVERGWKVSSLGPLLSMKERGLSDEAILDELLAIEIEIWNRRVHQMDSK